MDPITLNIKTAAGAKHSITVTSLSETVAAFKVRLAPIVDIPAEAQRLIFRGHVLKDDNTLLQVKEAHALADGHTMHLVRSGRPAPTPSPIQNTQQSILPFPAVPHTPTGVYPHPQQQNHQHQHHQHQHPATAHTLPPLGNMPSPFGFATANTPSNQQPPPPPAFGMAAPGPLPTMADMQRTLIENPEHMRAVINSPVMDLIMNNPELARSIMLANPQMQELIQRNPEVGHILNDSNTMRQMVQMMRNPSLMNEVTRNTDRQLANIEMMPGGFDALRRMHENIQAPLMDAAAAGIAPVGPDPSRATAAHAGATPSSANPFESLFQPQNNTPSNAPMPNPWAPNRGMPPPAAPYANPAFGAQNTPGNTGLFPNAFAAPPRPSAGNTPIGGTAGGLPNIPMDLFGMQNMDPEQMLQVLENPMMQTMMQSIMNDPAMLESMVATNPQLQALVQSNPQMMAMMRDPNMIRLFLNPDVIRGVMNMRSGMNMGQTQSGSGPIAPGPYGSLNPGVAGTQGHTPAATGVGAPPAATPVQGAAAQGTGQGTALPAPDMRQFFSLMQNLAPNAGVAGGFPSQAEPELTQEQLEPQLQQLRDMGFLDTSMCLDALRQARGNVNLAVEHLLRRFGN